MMKVVTALGWYDKHNIGDESYKLAFPTVFPDYEWHFTDKLTPEVVGQSDALVLGGGDIMSDPFLNQLAFIDKPKHIISTSATARTDVNKLVGYQNIIVRDFNSVEMLKQKGVQAKYKPDVAFALTPDRMRGKRLIRKEYSSQKRDLYEKVIIVIMNGYLADAESNSYDVRKFIDFHKLAYDLGHISDHTPASFMFIPFGQMFPWDDRVPNIWVAQKCKFWQKNLVVWNEPSVQNILDMISAADAVISTRLHSTIFSLVGVTPFIDIIHNHKNSALLNSIEKNNYSLPYEAFDIEKAKKMLKGYLFERSEPEKELQSTVDKLRALLKGLSDVRLV